MDLEITLLTQHLANALTLGFENSGQHEPLEQFLKYLEEQDQGLRVCLVACKNSEPLGYITIAWNSDCPYPEMGKTPTLKDLNVLPKYRRQGVGEHLLKAAEDFVSKNSKSKLKC